ncbi:MAG: DUF433 domain-containing protein [Bryobacteraceae bacterium]
MTATVSTSFEIDDRGVAWIAGTRIKVVEVVLDKLSHGWSPEEIHFQHPDLSLAQIHASLTYYYTHQAEFDSQIAHTRSEIRLLAQSVEDPILKNRLTRHKQTDFACLALKS